tara:strand:+ start:35020 stop:38862 length:3843 start_codon:yes stop_codon:yes gene_type:complete
MNVSFVFSQGLELYEIIEQPEQEWATKQVADLQRAPIILNQDLLQNLKNRTEKVFSVPGLNGELHEVEVTRVMEQPDGDWSILGHIDGDWMNSFTLSFSNGEVLSSLRFISSHHFMEIRIAEEDEEHYLLHINPHDRDELKCGFDHGTMSEVPDDRSIHMGDQKIPDPQPPAFIDVLVVYTPAAQSWAALNEGGINNVINQAIAISQNSVDNSNINLQFRLVHRAVVEYTESGNSRTDLNNLTNRVIPNVQSLRNQYSADLVVMLTDTEDMGGIAWLTTNRNGSPSEGFSITRVQQASWTTTMAHEFGHNMGSHHSRNQTIQPASESGGVFNYSTGWRWTGTDNQSYASIMAYTETSTAVDLFSNPVIFHQGVSTGSYGGKYAPADNSRSMREMMHVIAGYRKVGVNVVPPSVTTASVSNILSNSAQTGGNVSDDGGSSVISRGVCLSTQQNPNLSDTCRFTGSGLGSFNVTFTNLSANTTYFIRAFATNSEGTSYGTQQSFTTIRGLPLVSTSAIRDVSFKTAIGGGTITDSGSSAVTDRGICWSIRQNPGITDNCRSLGPGSGDFSAIIDKLIRDTIYYVRAYATNGQGRAFGEERSFVTLPVIVDANRSSISVSRLKVQANNQNSSVVTVIARDFEGVPLPGLETELTSKEGRLQVSPSTVMTDSNGEANFEVTNSTVEKVTYGAISGAIELSSEASVQYIGINADRTSIEVSSNVVQADGVAVARIAVTARDETNTPFSNLRMDLIPDGGNSVISAIRQTTDSNGVAIFNVSNQVAERIRYRARGHGTTTSSSVEVNFVSLDPVRSTVIADADRVEANGKKVATITVEAIDVNGEAIQGVLIRLSDGGAGTNIEPNEQRTNSDGLARFEVRNSSVSVVDFTATAIRSDVNVPIRQKVSIEFIPLAPNGLSATEVGTRVFQANWEMVSNSDSYLLDVATDSSFSNIVSGYESLDVGKVTSHRVVNVNPGTDYVYRVYSTLGGLIGAASEPITITTFPETPIGLQASDQNAHTFTANWQATEGARAYRIDVSLDAEFSEILTDYNNRNVGNITSFEVGGLEPGRTYYYRIRAEAGVRISGNSNIITGSTLMVSPENSIISQQQSRILANGFQTNEVRIIVKSENGVLLKGLTAEMVQEGVESDIDAIQSETDAEGIARFLLSSQNTGKTRYDIFVNGIRIGEVTVEFLSDNGILSLGNNYPNPFIGTTILPVSIPTEINVEMQIFDILGKPVQTIMNENLQPGFYEVTFDAHGLSAGIYFCRLMAGDEILMERMVKVN